MERTEEELRAAGGVDKLLLPFPFVCQECGRNNAALWSEMTGGGAVLVCKCGSEKLTEVRED